MAQNQNRLPTLNEVLMRRTLAPVDLFSFYIYMRDQQRSVDYLDFWLDVVQHMSLCRHFVREMRRSILVDTPQLEKSGAHSKRSSAILDQFGMLEDNGVSDNADMDKAKEQHISAFLRSENNGHSPSSSLGSNPRPNLEQTDSDSPVRDSNQRSRTTTNGTGPRPSGVSAGGLPRPSFMGSALNDTTSGSSPATHTVQRSDLRQSAEKILYTYLLQGSEREIILPQGILQDIIVSIEDDHRDDPEVFDAAKDYVFQAMERDAFPGFLRSKALGNLVPQSIFARGILGLVALFGGFWAAFVLIFRNYPRHTRCWLILPFAIGVYALASQQYRLDPLIAIFGYSEYTFFSFYKIKDPYVRSLLVKRGTMDFAITVLIGTAILCLFIFVPGKEL